jgi:KUP system potassium uptake protein
MIQQFGTKSIGKFFGPIMLAWFGMLAFLGLANIQLDWSILKSFSPHYAINLLFNYTSPDGGVHTAKGLLILGAVFLCTTGAEALYSDMGHCGRGNIRASWVVVKVCLILNYLGQGAWLLHNYSNQVMPKDINPFYALMPEWFKIPGIIIATLATIIASQALITGSFTLISEAMRLNLWPKSKIVYPSDEKGQIYIPGINWLLMAGCVAIVLIFRESSNMEAAYGLSITITMLMTSILFSIYLFSHRVDMGFILFYLLIYITIELGFLTANMLKFFHGGYVTVIVAGLLFFIMYCWYNARKIKNRFVEFVKLDDHLKVLVELSNDTEVPKYATHLVYMSSADNPKEIEHKIIYSILNKRPKRADIYWFLHVHVVDEPFRQDYVVQTIIPNEVVRIEFRLGFKVEQKINLMFQKVVEELVKNKEVDVVSRYESLSKQKITGDFKFIVMEKFLSNDNELPFWEQLIMRVYFYVKKLSLSEERGFGLDSNYVKVEKFPLIINPVNSLNLRRVDK